MSASWEVQKALYSALKGDTTFMGLINNKLYDEPPTNSSYPYVTCSDMIEISDNDLSHRGFEVSAIFSIYTKPAGLGFYQAKQILGAMNTVLNIKRFSLTGYEMIVCKFDNAITERDDDIRIITVRYTVLVDSNTLITY